MVSTFEWASLMAALGICYLLLEIGTHDKGLFTNVASKSKETRKSSKNGNIGSRTKTSMFVKNEVLPTRSIVLAKTFMILTQVKTPPSFMD